MVSSADLLELLVSEQLENQAALEAVKRFHLALKDHHDKLSEMLVGRIY